MVVFVVDEIWRDVGCCGSLHARRIRFDLTCDTAAALLFLRVLPFACLTFGIF